MKKIEIRYKTNNFFPKNNFWVGIGSVLNLAGNYFEYNYSSPENEADRKSLKSDWDNVGEDIKHAGILFTKENK